MVREYTGRGVGQGPANLVATSNMTVLDYLSGDSSFDRLGNPRRRLETIQKGFSNIIVAGDCTGRANRRTSQQVLRDMRTGELQYLGRQMSITNYIAPSCLSRPRP